MDIELSQEDAQVIVDNIEVIKAFAQSKPFQWRAAEQMDSEWRDWSYFDNNDDDGLRNILEISDNHFHNVYRIKPLTNQ